MKYWDQLYARANCVRLEQAIELKFGLTTVKTYTFNPTKFELNRVRQSGAMAQRRAGNGREKYLF